MFIMALQGLAFGDGAPPHAFQPLRPCPVVNKPKDQLSWVPSTSFAESTAALTTQYRKGAVLIIGANEGKVDNDPTFKMLTSKTAEQLHKVFVEPIPWLFNKLQQNLAGIPHTHAVQAAISNQSGVMDMFCFAMDPTLGPPAKWPEDLRMKSRFGSSKREGRGWWTQICSLSRDRLFNANDMGHDFPNPRKTLEPYITNTTVKVITMDELLTHYAPAVPIRQ